MTTVDTILRRERRPSPFPRRRPTSHRARVEAAVILGSYTYLLLAFVLAVTIVAVLIG
ncbi:MULTISPECIES: hypothetical protein [Pseudonocardia]|uniref:Uncharacterized protein n=1 Tax=Pseudonocardia autotrophica TaxID=2074 RepID=A0A1Y2MN75_PSEAH|nr:MULTISPECIES: hypothetical protein [Pseudonocardia]OSY36107.1 hypothetical protein BG845_05622 [Pseudonocardia autotrophica]TDN77589.1 hypothetical protein C8E95_6838 [Pseudonocardia autotrophica]